jgi:23S rRNA pseudouridine2605 synthase
MGKPPRKSPQRNTGEPGSEHRRAPGGRAASRQNTPALPEAPTGRRGRNRTIDAAGKAAKPERIAKLLARAGVGSRRDIERMIAEGRVALDGAVLETPATILADLARVTVDGRPVAAAESTRLFRFHKPSGFLTAARDPGGRPTIYDALPPGLPRLVPVGRLDLNTEGLLLLTNDGALKRALELPASGVPRSYRVRAYGEVRQSDLEALAQGVTLAGIRYGPVVADVDRSSAGRNIWLTMTLAEGKNREVRKLCEAMGLQVSRLIRVGYGPFLLGELAARGVDEATPAEIAELRRMLGLSADVHAAPPPHTSAGAAPPPPISRGRTGERALRGADAPVGGAPRTGAAGGGARSAAPGAKKPAKPGAKPAAKPSTRPPGRPPGKPPGKTRTKTPSPKAPR